MRKDFCAFILTHGRPSQVQTARTLRKHGYTGKVFIVIDDEDDAGEEYKRIYGDDVLVFSKDEVARYTDQFDNFSDRRAILWARNVCWDLARLQGLVLQRQKSITHGLCGAWMLSLRRWCCCLRERPLKRLRSPREVTTLVATLRLAGEGFYGKR